MQIEATTRIHYAAYRKYFLFNFLQGKRSPWQARILIIFAPLVFAAFLALYLADPSDVVNLIGMLVMLAMNAILAAILFILPRRYYRKVQDLIELPTHYAFTGSHIEAGPEKAAAGEREATRYELVSRAYETRDFFYIYVGLNQAYIIGKNDFTAGSAPELAALLEEKLAGRFHVARIS